MVISQREAQRIVGDKDFAATFEALKYGYMAAWANTAPAESEKRELAYQHFKVVSDVWAALMQKAQAAHVRDLKAENPNG